MQNKLKIAVSGKSGCGNSTVSGLLAKKLGLKLINYTFHNMADEAGIDFMEFLKLAEQDSRYDLELDRRQVEMAEQGACVLGSRLAIWILKSADLKVYLEAGPEVRAARIAGREEKNLDIIRQQTAERDARDSARYMRLYGIDNNSYSFADLVVNTDNKTPEEIVLLIISVLTEKGLL
jgi:cytidylate kinase